jgi:sugar phosphate isomerase/epimerase
MNNVINRRAFLMRSLQATLTLSSLGFGAAIPASAVEPVKRTGSPRLLLSLAAYSFRDYFVDANHARAESKIDPSKRIDMFQFVNYCADHGCSGAEVTSYYFPEKLTDDYLIKLRRHAFLRGIAISGTAIGNDFTHPPGEKLNEQIKLAKTWVDIAAILGAPHIRIFAGSGKGISKEEAKKMCIGAIEECSDYAGTKGIFLGLENHGGIVAEADDILDIVRAVKSPWVGINLDTGNFHTDDPYADLAKCAPYAVNVQLKADIQKHGQKQEPSDLPRLAKILREANYQGYVALEYESAEDPWKAVPVLLKKMKDLFAA